MSIARSDNKPLPHLENLENRPNIWIHTPFASGGSFIKDVRPLANKYRQSSRLIGGYWQASFELPGMSASAMKSFFNTKIGSHVESRIGGVQVWEGLIWSMDFRDKGVTRRITLDDCRNKVKCNYRDESTGNDSETSWYSASDSQDRYGVIEEIVRLDKIQSTAAQAYAQTILTENQIPVVTPVQLVEPKIDEIPTLKVECVGYAYTLNFKYVTISDTARTITAAINAVLAADVEFVTGGDVATNSVTIGTPDTDTKVWDWFEELTEIGDGSNPYTMTIYNNRRFQYGPLSPTPTIVWDGTILRTGGMKPLTKSHYAIKPGVLRDLTWDQSTLASSYFLEKRCDSIITEVEAGEEYHMPQIKNSRYLDSELLAALARIDIDSSD